MYLGSTATMAGLAALPLGRLFGWPATGGSSGGLYLRPRDLAKFGTVYLNGGKWKGEQIVPEEWVSESLVPRINNMSDFHDGIDLPVPSKTPVLAVRDSVVYLAGEASTRAWGPRHIVLQLDPLPEHSDLYAVYLHLARIEIPVDRRVRQGQRIGWAEIDGALLGGSSHRTTEATFTVREGLASNAVPALPDAETADRVESLRGWI